MDRRIEVRLDAHRAGVLEDELATRGQTVSDWIRQQIDNLEERQRVERALQAVRELAALNLEWVPADPDELERIINEQDSPVDDDWQPS